MGEIKEMMRNSLNIKTFQNEPVNKPGGFEEPRQSAAAHRSPMRSTKLGQLEQQFDVVNFGKSQKSPMTSNRGSTFDLTNPSPSRKGSTGRPGSSGYGSKGRKSP